jgi:arylsulfatase A-like enzyme
MGSEVSRRDFIGISGATALTGLVAPLDTAAQTAADSKLAKRPNIIFFMPDEMRADALACYGNPITKTPNFDRLAKEGTRFSNCQVQYPVCGASRCSLLTGWPTSVRGHRSLYYFLRPDEPNLFRYLRRGGYDVYWFGKNDALAAQTFADSVTEWSDVTATVAGGAAGAAAARPTDLTPGVNSMLYSAGGTRTSTSDYAQFQKALQIIERKESERPFCIYLPLSQPHPPYTISPDFYDMYSPASLPELAPSGLPKKPDFHAGIRELYGLSKLDDATFRKIKAVYYGQVSYSDWLMGELLAALERKGRDKDTAVFLFADHGDYTGDFGLVEKWPSGLEDCLTHVPLIVRVPGGKQGVVADEMVELYDVMQTSLDLAGTTAQHTHFSRSLIPQITGGSGDPDRAAFAEGGYNIYEPQCFEPLGAGGGPYVGKIRLQNERPETVSRSAMVRTRDYKLIVRPQGQSELYSSKDDPQERNNLVGDTSVGKVQADLQNKLLNHCIETTGIAPTDKDPRDLPAFYPTNENLKTPDWQRNILDKS